MNTYSDVVSQRTRQKTWRRGLSLLGMLMFAVSGAGKAHAQTLTINTDALTINGSSTLFNGQLMTATNVGGVAQFLIVGDINLDYPTVNIVGSRPLNLIATNNATISAATHFNVSGNGTTGIAGGGASSGAAGGLATGNGGAGSGGSGGSGRQGFNYPTHSGSDGTGGYSLSGNAGSASSNGVAGLAGFGNTTPGAGGAGKTGGGGGAAVSGGGGGGGGTQTGQGFTINGGGSGSAGAGGSTGTAGTAGGAGGGGAGGTILLYGSVVSANGGTLSAAGGGTGATGRIVIARNNADTMGGTLTGNLENNAGQAAANTFITGNPTTPYLADLNEGAQIYGTAGVGTSAFPSVVNGANGAPAALYRVHVGPQSPVNSDFAGYDYVFFINLSGTTLLNPTLGIGTTPQALRLSAVSKNALGGTIALTALPANQVWVTLVPSNAASNISASFQKGSAGFNLTSVSLPNGAIRYFTQTPPVASLAGAALQFDGVTSVVTVPHNNALNAYPLTVSAWINTTQSNASGEVVNKYVSGTLNGWQLFLLNGNIQAFYFGPSGFNSNVWDGDSGTFNGGNVADGKWHNVVFTVDASGGKLYVDSALKNSLGWTGIPGAATTTTPLHIGSDGGTFTFNGQIDDVQIWNRALSASELQFNLNASLAGTEPGLAAYYRLDEGRGTTVKDATANHFDGTLNGNPLWAASSAPIDTVNVQFAPRPITLAGFDAGGNPLTFSISSNPAKGSISGSSPTFTYTPGLDYRGTDSFTYTANNGSTTANAATVKIRYGVTTASVTGSIKFSGLVVDALPQNVTFEFRDPNTNAALFQIAVPVPASGTYTLTNIPLQNYTLWIKGEKYLAATTTVTSSGTTFNTAAQVTVKGGDATNDNTIDIGDFGLLVNAYGGDVSITNSGYDIRADFNGDGIVDIGDFGILVNNYTLSGAP